MDREQPSSKFERVWNDIDCKQFGKFLFALISVFALFNYYAWMLGRPGIGMLIGSGIGCLLIVLGYCVSPKFRTVVFYYAWGLTYGPGKACAGIMANWIFLTYEVRHLEAMTDADFSILRQERNLSVEAFGEYHQNTMELVRLCHFWVWVPLALYLVFCTWHCNTVLDILQAKFFMTGADSSLL